MTRWAWARAVTAALACAGSAAGQAPQSPVGVSPSAASSPRATDGPRDGDVLTFRTAGQPERRVKVLRISGSLDGDSLADLQDLNSGAKYSVPTKVLLTLWKAAEKPQAANSTPTPVRTTPTPAPTTAPAPVATNAPRPQPVSVQPTPSPTTTQSPPARPVTNTNNGWPTSGSPAALAGAGRFPTTMHIPDPPPGSFMPFSRPKLFQPAEPKPARPATANPRPSSVVEALQFATGNRATTEPIPTTWQNNRPSAQNMPRAESNPVQTAQANPNPVWMKPPTAPTPTVATAPPSTLGKPQVSITPAPAVATATPAPSTATKLPPPSTFLAPPAPVSGTSIALKPTVTANRTDVASAPIITPTTQPVPARPAFPLLPEMPSSPVASSVNTAPKAPAPVPTTPQTVQSPRPVAPIPAPVSPKVVAIKPTITPATLAVRPDGPLCSVSPAGPRRFVPTRSLPILLGAQSARAVVPVERSVTPAPVMAATMPPMALPTPKTPTPAPVRPATSVATAPTTPIVVPTSTPPSTAAVVPASTPVLPNPAPTSVVSVAPAAVQAPAMPVMMPTPVAAPPAIVVVTPPAAPEIPKTIESPRLPASTSVAQAPTIVPGSNEIKPFVEPRTQPRPLPAAPMPVGVAALPAPDSWRPAPAAPSAPVTMTTSDLSKMLPVAAAQAPATSPIRPVSLVTIEPSPVRLNPGGIPMPTGDQMMDELAPLFRDLFQALRPSVRERAATTLADGRYGSRPEVKAQIAKAADVDADPTVRAQCIRLLSRLGYHDSGYMDNLATWAESGPPVVRHAAQKALEKLAIKNADKD